MNVEKSESEQRIEIFDNVLAYHGAFIAHYHGYTCVGCEEHLGNEKPAESLRQHQAEMINASLLALPERPGRLIIKNFTIRA